MSVDFYKRWVVPINADPKISGLRDLTVVAKMPACEHPMTKAMKKVLIANRRSTGTIRPSNLPNHDYEEDKCRKPTKDL